MSLTRSGPSWSAPREVAGVVPGRSRPPNALDRWLARLWAPRPFLPRIPARDRRLLERVEALRADEHAALALPRLRAGLRAGDDEALATALAFVARVCQRETGLRPYPPQLAGSLLICRGVVAEMATGEGKTLTVMIAAAVRALAGDAVHVVTVNDYLAQRDAALARPLLQALGLRTGCVVHGLEPADKQRAYAADVVYCSNKELVFDFLRARLQHGPRPSGLAAHARRLGGRGHGGASAARYEFAIVDEADSVLLDEALTPLIIATGREDFAFDEALTTTVVGLARELRADEDFRVDRLQGRVELTEPGKQHVCRALDLRRWGLDLDRAKLEFAHKALHALHLLQRDRAYIVRDGKVQIVDEGTGRILGDRSWEDGLHQMVEAKEGVPMTAPRRSVERISFQQFFRQYRGLAGTTGTAREVAGELFEHYGLRVVAVPLHRPSQRHTWPARVFVDRRAQHEAVAARAAGLVAQGRPVLIGTRHVGESEALAAHLDRAGLDFALLNARHEADEAEVVASAGEPGRVTVATNMAGRGTDIRLPDEVVRRGGLHVILTELHDARRIDRQLAGRCARQGDPGSFERMLRLDKHGTLAPGLDRLLLRVARHAWPAGGRGPGPWLVLAVRRVAQWWRQRQHAATRRRLVAAEAADDGLAEFESGVGR